MDNFDTRFDALVASGRGVPKLKIRGRPKPGEQIKYVLLEEPGKPVLMHFVAGCGQMPHLNRACPHCRDCAPDALRPLWYVGAAPLFGRGGLVIVELTDVCYDTAAAAACHFDPDGSYAEIANRPPVFTGLEVEISRAGSAYSPRVLRCERRYARNRLRPWPYRTRYELARIWNVPCLRPALAGVPRETSRPA